MRMYKEIIDPKHEWTAYDCVGPWREAVGAGVIAGRSNCRLDTTNLIKQYPHILDARQSIRQTLLRMKQRIDAQNETVVCEKLFSAENSFSVGGASKIEVTSVDTVQPVELS